MYPTCSTRVRLFCPLVRSEVPFVDVRPDLWYSKDAEVDAVVLRLWHALHLCEIGAVRDPPQKRRFCLRRRR